MKRAIALFQPDVSLLVLRHPAHNHASLFRGQPPEKAPGEDEKVISQGAKGGAQREKRQMFEGGLSKLTKMVRVLTKGSLKQH